MKKGKKYTSRVVVSNALTAKEMGSGDMPVYATPAMVALVENAAMMCVADDIEEDSAMGNYRWFVGKICTNIP